MENDRGFCIKLQLTENKGVIAMLSSLDNFGV